LILKFNPAKILADKLESRSSIIVSKQPEPFENEEKGNLLKAIYNISFE